MEELYEESKEGPRALLDEIFEFEEKYIYGCGSSNEDGELSTLSKSGIEGHIDHLKDKAKVPGISFQDKSQISKEIRQLKAMKTKLEAPNYQNTKSKPRRPISNFEVKIPWH